jgi:hypothetical protein
MVGHITPVLAAGKDIFSNFFPALGAAVKGSVLAIAILGSLRKLLFGVGLVVSSVFGVAGFRAAACVGIFLAFDPSWLIGGRSFLV